MAADDIDIATLVRRLSRRPLWVPPPELAVDLGRASVARLLPHRDPFLLIDGVTAADPSRGLATAQRTLDPADPVFSGHFPGNPVYPGVLLVEAMGQAGILALALRDRATSPIDVRVTRVHHAVFLAAALPGDTLTLHAEILTDDSLTALVATQAVRGQTICAVCVLEVYLA